MAWPTTVMYVNDRDLAEFQMQMTLPRGFMSAPGRADKMTDVPGRLGSLRVGRETDVGPRRFTVAGVIRAIDTTTLLTNWDKATTLLADEDLEVRFSAWPDRVGLGARCVAVDWQEVPGSTAFANITLTFLMPNPVKVATQPDIYTIADGAEVALELGSAPSDVHLKFISSGGTTPTVSYKDAQGLIRGSLLFDEDAAAFPVGQWIDWDGTLQLATQYGYTAPNIISVPVAPTTDSLPFVADPADGDGTVGPSLFVQNCRAVAMVWKGWY